MSTVRATIVSLRRAIAIVLLATVVVALLRPGRATAAKPENAALSAVERGNSEYQEGNYEQARDRYLEALANGISNGHLYYNLGNAYYRLNEIGRAIASYRRALLDLPRDPDINANLTLARTKTRDQITLENDVSSVIERTVMRLVPPLTTHEAEAVLLAIYALGWAVFLMGSFRDRPEVRSFGLGLVGVTMILAVFVYGTAPGRLGERRLALTPGARRVHPVVVTARECSARAGDGESFQVIAVLHDGAELLSDERRGDWIAVFLPGERRGWIRASDGESIL